MTAGLRVGTTNGFAWIEVPLSEDCSDRMIEATRDCKGPVIIIHPPGRVLEREHLTRLQQKNVNKFFYPRHIMGDHIGFRPFDEVAEFPNNQVAYAREQFRSSEVERWIGEWARTQVEIPDNIDVEFQYCGYKGKMHVIATTMKDGALTKVSRKISDKVPFKEAVAPILAYFSRNCPRIREGMQADFVCGSHINAILEEAAPPGLDFLRNAIADAKAQGKRMRVVKLPETLMREDGIVTSLRLQMAETGTRVHAEIDLRGGHHIAEDAQGLTVTLNIVVTDTILASLKGRSLGDLIDAEWARGMQIRNAKVEKESNFSNSSPNKERLILRTSYEKEPVRIPVKKAMTEAEIRRGLQRLVGTLPDIQESAMLILRRMRPIDVLTVLSLVMVQERVLLRDFGQDEWILTRMGGRIRVDNCPSLSFKNVLKELDLVG